MKWFTTIVKPTIHKTIVVVYKEDTQLRVFSGEVMTTAEYPDDGIVWTVCASDMAAKYIKEKDIVGWVTGKYICNDAHNETRKIDVEVKCEWCGHHTNVIARVIRTEWMQMPVIQYTGTGNRCYLNWDEFDAECEFEYICENCENVLAGDLMSLEELVHKQQSAKSFYDDDDKMLDLLLLSKEEFLKSYSYITEEDYNLTVEELWSKVGKKKKKTITNQSTTTTTNQNKRYRNMYTVK